MNIPFIRRLYAYNRWANDRVLSTVAELTGDEFTRMFPVNFGSIQGTMAHILGVERLYLQRWNGIFPRSLPKATEFPDVERLRSYWQSVLSGQDTFLGNLTEGKLEQRFTYVNLVGETFGYPLVDMMQHMVNHSTYHRGQVASLLRMLGKKPVETDYLLYLDEN